jgi:DNA-binding transcriptional regulator YdaS (Cro superfamily)
MNAIDLLRQRVEAQGQGVIARELGISKTAVSQILSGKYQADPGHILARVLNIYGSGDELTCPHKGVKITPAECAAQYGRAQAVGLRATGNPETLRQHHACLKGEIRS